MRVLGKGVTHGGCRQALEIIARRGNGRVTAELLGVCAEGLGGASKVPLVLHASLVALRGERLVAARVEALRIFVLRS